MIGRWTIGEKSTNNSFSGSSGEYWPVSEGFSSDWNNVKMNGSVSFDEKRRKSNWEEEKREKSNFSSKFLRFQFDSKRKKSSVDFRRRILGKRKDSAEEETSRPEFWVLLRFECFSSFRRVDRRRSEREKMFSRFVVFWSIYLYLFKPSTILLVQIDRFLHEKSLKLEERREIFEKVFLTLRFSLWHFDTAGFDDWKCSNSKASERRRTKSVQNYNTRTAITFFMTHEFLFVPSLMIDRR